MAPMRWWSEFLTVGLLTMLALGLNWAVFLVWRDWWQAWH